jgi:hypothetical protein
MLCICVVYFVRCTLLCGLCYCRLFRFMVSSLLSQDMGVGRGGMGHLEEGEMLGGGVGGMGMGLGRCGG